MVFTDINAVCGVYTVGLITPLCRLTETKPIISFLSVGYPAFVCFPPKVSWKMFVKRFEVMLEGVSDQLIHYFMILVF